MQKQQSTVIFVTRGSDPLMQEVRRILSELQESGQPIAQVSSFTGDVSYSDEAVAVFIYDDYFKRSAVQRTSSGHTPACYRIGLSDSLHVAAPAWAPNAKMLIALSPELLAENLAHHLKGALLAVRQALDDTSLRELPVLNRPSKEYIEALENRHGIIGS